MADYSKDKKSIKDQIKHTESTRNEAQERGDGKLAEGLSNALSGLKSLLKTVTSNEKNRK